MVPKKKVVRIILCSETDVIFVLLRIIAQLRYHHGVPNNRRHPMMIAQLRNYSYEDKYDVSFGTQNSQQEHYGHPYWLGDGQNLLVGQ